MVAAVVVVIAQMPQRLPRQQVVPRLAGPQRGLVVRGREIALGEEVVGDEAQIHLRPAPADRVRRPVPQALRGRVESGESGRVLAVGPGAEPAVDPDQTEVAVAQPEEVQLPTASRTSFLVFSAGPLRRFEPCPGQARPTEPVAVQGDYGGSHREPGAVTGLGGVGRVQQVRRARPSAGDPQFTYS